MTVGYCRLSRDEDKENYSSIDSQKELIEKYASSHGMTVDQMFVDDNFSGYVVTKYDDTLFDRPDYIRMVDLVRQGKVNAILVKDESRIGRKQSVVLINLDRFQRLGCKCIDVQQGKELPNDITGVTTWSNEQFIRQTSQKVRSVFHSKQEKGSLIMGDYYGYIRKDKTALVVNEDLRPCIQLIFHLYLCGNGYVKIAKYLNEKTNYPTPSAYCAEQHRIRGRVYRCRSNTVWESHHIPRILMDDIYCGVLTTHKKEVVGIKGRAVRIPEEQRFKFPGHHEAIISREDFDLAQQLRNKRNAVCYRGSNFDYLFKGFGICTQCNHRVGGLILRRSSDKAAYNCDQYIRYGTRGCSNKVISEIELIKSFKTFLADTLENYRDCLEKIDYKSMEKETENRLDKARREQAKTEEELRALISLKSSEIASKPAEYQNIIKAQYEKAEIELLQKINRSIQYIACMERQSVQGNEEKRRSYMDVMNEVMQCERPGRKLVEMLIDRICFNADKSITFQLNVGIDD